MISVTIEILLNVTGKKYPLVIIV